MVSDPYDHTVAAAVCRCCLRFGSAVYLITFSLVDSPCCFVDDTYNTPATAIIFRPPPSMKIVLSYQVDFTA